MPAFPYARSRLVLFGVVVPLLLALLTGCFGRSGSTTTVSTGSLVVNSEPEGADIMLDGKPTGQKTPYQFNDLAPGMFDVTLVLEGYPQQGPRGVIVNKGETTSLLIDMDAEYVTGRVVFGRGGPSVARSIIRAYRDGSDEAAGETISDESGSFTLSLPPGRYNIVAHQPDTWAAGAAQGIDVPANGPVEIIQRDLFAHGDSGNPQILSVKVTGLEPGDIVSGSVDITVEVQPQDAHVRFIGARVGHQDPHLSDHATTYDDETLSFTLNPPNYGPGSTYLHVVAYDVQLNSAQLVIPFTIAPNPEGEGEPLPAPENVEVYSYTFLNSRQIFSVDQMNTLADALSPYGVSAADVAPEIIPPYNRWVRIRWDFVPGAAGYRVYRRAEGSQESMVVADWANWLRPTMYTDASAALVPGTRYYYSVRAYDENGQLGLASDEIPIILLEPFEARLTEPEHHEVVGRWPGVILRWQKSSLPPIPGHTYEYVYHVGLSSELFDSGLTPPEIAVSVRDREHYQVAYNDLMAGRSYQWDLIAAYATVQVSERSRAFTVSGKYHPLTDPSGMEPGGGSTNGAFRFTVAP